MDPREQHLKVLGLPPDATWTEVTQAYKDLMRVWHPDRFPNDERLQKKAEEQSQQINRAMSELRKLGKEPSKPQPKPKRSQHIRPEPQHYTRPQTSHTSAQSKASFHYFSIAPLVVRQRVFTSLTRVIVAAILFWLALQSMVRITNDRYQSAIAAAFLFYSLDVGVRNIILLVSSKPIVSVDQGGLFLSKIGRLNWIDFDQVWPTLSPRGTTLHIRFSEHYMTKLPWMMRALYYLRSVLRTAHTTVGFTGLSSTAVQVVNALKLQQMHENLIVEDLPPAATGKRCIAQLACLTCAVAVVVRCLIRNKLVVVDWLPHVGLFTICRAADLITGLSRYERRS